MIKSTTHSGLEIIQNDLQLYYDVGNVNSYSYLSPTTNRLYNLARLDNIIIPESGSSAIISPVYASGTPSILPAPFNGVLQNTLLDFVETPGFLDFESLSYDYSIEMIFKLVTLSISQPAQENYLIKSYDNNNGLYIKFNGSDIRDLEIGSSNFGTEIYRTNMSEGGVYHFVFTRNATSDDIKTYVNGSLQMSRKQTLYTTFTGPIKIAYGFDSIWFSQFRLYTKELSIGEVGFNFAQYKTFRFGDQ